MTPIKEKQSSSNILMIRPINFGFNYETASSNAFQDSAFAEAHKNEAQAIALQEFDAMVAYLRSKKINIIVVEDTPNPVTTDSIFPNNWVSFHADGTVVTYPMQAVSRRLERRTDIIELLNNQFIINTTVALESYEAESKFLEGTGSMVLDRTNKIAYACLSPRTSLEVLHDFGKKLGYEIMAFDAADHRGLQIYHTNVLMCVGTDFAVICLDAIPVKEYRQFVENKLAESGKEVINISFEQMNQFAGNMLEVQNTEGKTYIVMSMAANNALTSNQKEQLSKYGEILANDLTMIEGNGGGSARCMMAEVHLPVRG